MGHYPSGTSMNVLFHFLQDIRDDQISTEFDYYKKVGDAKHSPNQIKETINLHPIRDLGVPISMFVGTRDILATISDSRRIWDLIGPDTGHIYNELEADHLSLLIGKDMTYFTDTVMSILADH